VFFALGVEGSAARGLVACDAQPPSSPTLFWEELVETDPESLEVRPTLAIPKAVVRDLLNPSRWFKSVANEKTEPREPAHPLRTNLWEVKLRWRGPARHKNSGVYSHCKLVLEFDPTGYVRVKPSDDACDGWIAAGKWKLDPARVTFAIPFPVEALDKCDQGETTLKQHYFETDFHINPFGPQPKFTRGVVYRENGSKWFRPVVATFSATGIGKDTADLSYRKRKLPKQL
jgi:hypothetical protein